MANVISQSMVGDLLSCSQKWAFAWGDIAGFPIRAKTPALVLREGRAWDRGAKVFHSSKKSTEEAVGDAYAAILGSLEEDADEMVKWGSFDEEEYQTALEKLKGALVQYAATTPRLNLVASEVLLEVPFSDGFVYRCHLDGVHQDEDGALWVVEFKWRKRLTPLDQIVLWRQIRWYAMALEQGPATALNLLSSGVCGIIVDERLNGAPTPVKVNKDGSISATQSCTLEEYLDACQWPQNYGGTRVTTPNERTVGLLGQKVWQARHEILLRSDEMMDAVRELESAAKLIDLYRRRELLPIRNPGSQCASCSYRDLCPTPDDHRLRDTIFVRNDWVDAPKDEEAMA